MQENKNNELANRNVFYLKEPKFNKRATFVTGLIIVLISIMNPMFFLVLFLYIIYSIYKNNDYKKEENVLLSKAIESYKSEEYSLSLENSDKVLDINNKNNKALIISALSNFYKGNYPKYIELINNVPKNSIELDLDLQLKLGESYEFLGDIEKAKAVYKNLYKIFPESKYLKGKLGD